MRNFLFAFLAIILFSSCWHQQWEDRLASGDTGIVTHGPKSNGPDTSTYSGHSNNYNSSSSNYVSGHVPDGKALFHTYCATCHNASAVRSTGPGLQGVLDRIPSREWAYIWVRNSDSLIKSGDGYASKVFESNGKIHQPGFPNLTNQEVDAILDYCTRGPVYPLN
jgi:hypothetical protein